MRRARRSAPARLGYPNCTTHAGNGQVRITPRGLHRQAGRRRFEVTLWQARRLRNWTPADAAQRPGNSKVRQQHRGALAASSCAGTSQTLGVPFGQAGLEMRLIDKMQWMSQQNLRSVEIRLTRELGPL